MKIADNTLSAVYDYAIKELKDLYPENEVRKFIKMAAEFYFGHDTLYLSKTPIVKYTESELLKFVFLTKDLKKGRPIQYILGICYFFNLSLKVNDSVLIPRQETEELVDWLIKSNADKAGQYVLDIGTGSGCIAVSLAKNLSKVSVDASDVSKEALAVASVNAEINNVKINLIEDNILKHDISKYSTYDIIISNPPYVLRSEKEMMHTNVVDNEPHTALFVNDDNALVYYKAIIDFAKIKLKNGGELYFEINESRGKEIIQLLEDNGFNDVELRNDLNGKERMAKGFLIYDV